MRLHDLRHTFASVGAGASLGLPIVGKLLGHSQPQTTARYAHLDADPLRRAANIIGDHLSAAMRPKAPATEKPESVAGKHSATDDRASRWVAIPRRRRRSPTSGNPNSVKSVTSVANVLEATAQVQLTG